MEHIKKLIDPESIDWQILYETNRNFMQDAIEKGDEFEDIAIELQPVHENEDNTRFQKTRANATANKLGQLRPNHSKRPIVTFKDKGFIGQIGKGNCRNPRHHIADRSGPVEQIIAG